MAKLTRYTTLFALTLIALLAFGACKTVRPYDYSKEPDPRTNKRGFVIGPADQVRITVWRHGDLTTTATVRPDGIITMPLIGDIRAAGRNTKQLRDEIRSRLAKFYKDAQLTITVAVTNVVSYRFTVSGQVARPGLFASSRFVTVQEAIAMAGGPTRFAKPDLGVVVRRGRGGKTRRIPIDYPAIASGKAPKQNIVLLRGDVVHIP
jgi:polysaccharide export outer membrane protein